MSQKTKSLRFVTWNTNGIKNPPEKCSNIFNNLQELKSDIVFLQETHIGPDDDQNEIVKNIFFNEGETIVHESERWKVYSTVYSPRSKGVAILIRDNKNFEYICCDEDCSGGYIVLFCRIYGEHYTLVNVYNHKEDREILPRLKEYLKETAEGVLVVGGDFNTVLNPSRDRKASLTESPLKKPFKDFIELLIDTWSYKHKDNETENRFTRKQGDSASRIDMFFLQEDTIKRMTKIEVKKIESISDHYPLVLELGVQMQTEQEFKNVTTKLKKCEYNSDRRAGKISGAEILSAIKSLPAQNRPENWHSETETLKANYNSILKSQQVPENFIYSEEGQNFTREYCIFSEVLAKRLSAFISFKTKCTFCVIVIFESSEQTIKWSFLKAKLENLKQTPFVPPPEFSILDLLLPKTKSTSGDLRDLQPDCPLTNTVLNLALDILNQIVSSEAEKTTVCYYKQTLIIHAQQNKQEQVVRLVEKFQEDSGVRLTYK